MSNDNNHFREWVTQFRRLALGVSVGLCVGSASGQVPIAQTPLFLTSSADPNIMFVLDDSGSMMFEVTPEQAIGSDARYIYPRVNGNYGADDYTNRVPSFRSEVGDGSSASERAFAAMMRSPRINKSYYDPAVTYKPWAKPAGTPITGATPPVDASKNEFEHASITAAPNHPFFNTGTRNLTGTNTQSAIWVYCNNYNGGTGWTSCSASANSSRSFYPAVYFRYDGGAVNVRDSYTRIEIRPEASRPAPFTGQPYTGEGRTNRTDCALAAVGSCTYAEEIQNFANWYTYYRSRMLSAQAGIGRAFVSQPENMRVGFGSINQGSNSVDGVSTPTIRLGVRPFTGSDRNAFFSRLYTGITDRNGTPLREALDDAGRYFSRTDNRGPWGAVPGVDNTTAHLTCRQSYTILMTDGYWSTGTAPISGNIDGSNGPTITGPNGQTYTYSAVTPFTDSRSGTLADVAMYYWKRDLRPTLDNKVPVSPRNPAFWQHMVTYGVGLGVTGSVDPATAFSAIDADPPVSVTWTNPFSSDDAVSEPAKIDDLLHASVNARGGFFSAADPETFAKQLSDVLSDIVARVAGSGTSAATSSAVLQTDTLLYNASFRSNDWSGTIVAREVQDDGNPGAKKWDAEEKLAGRSESSRNIFTLKSSDDSAVALQLGNLSTAQQAALAVNPTGAAATAATAEDRIAWLRGVDNPGLRSRASAGTPSITQKIGDIIGSDPLFVSRRDYGYSLIQGPEKSSYNAFRATSAYKNRPDVIYVGTNGGMLHAFHAGTPYVGTPPSTSMDPDGGTELFAYVPSELLLPGTSGAHAQINELMRSDYSHRYFVDGSAETSDAYWDGSWKTVLVGAMGAGGRTVFALDVTDPENFSATKVLWEFRYANVPCVADPTGAAGSKACRDIGYGVTKPKVVRLPTGRWAAVFGNGYNSDDHRAKLMVVDLKTGRLLYVVDSGQGSLGATTSNGMGPVETTDWPVNNLNLSRVYAGDLLGNLWRVQFPANGAAPIIARVFTATDGAGTRQPITSKPKIALRPGSTSELVITVGTGSFFRTGDDSTVSPQVQTFYGVFDNSTATVTNVIRSQLRAQTITTNSGEVVVGSKTWPAGSLRYVTQNSLSPSDKGWRLDLPVAGERVISEATFPSGAFQERVRFTTLIPDDDPCGSGRNGFVLDICLVNGGRCLEPNLDLNEDGNIDSADTTGGGTPSGLGGTTGETLTTIRAGDKATDYMYGGDGNKVGDSRNTAGPAGRQSWRQLR